MKGVLVAAVLLSLDAAGLAGVFSPKEKGAPLVIALSVSAGLEGVLAPKLKEGVLATVLLVSDGFAGVVTPKENGV